MTFVLLSVCTKQKYDYFINKRPLFVPRNRLVSLIYHIFVSCFRLFTIFVRLLFLIFTQFRIYQLALYSALTLFSLPRTFFVMRSRIDWHSQTFRYVYWTKWEKCFRFAWYALQLPLLMAHFTIFWSTKFVYRTHSFGVMHGFFFTEFINWFMSFKRFPANLLLLFHSISLCSMILKSLDENSLCATTDREWCIWLEFIFHIHPVCIFEHQALVLLRLLFFTPARCNDRYGVCSESDKSKTDNNC